MFFATRPDLGNIKTSFPIFHRAAWDTALSTEALRLVGYDLAAGLSEIYCHRFHDATNGTTGQFDFIKVLQTGIALAPLREQIVRGRPVQYRSHPRGV